MSVYASAGSRNAGVERHFYIDSLGVVYPLDLDSGDRVVLSDEGSGMPPIEYITERAPYQHGETIKDYFLRPRVVQYLIRQKFCSRMDAWAGRNALLNALRPNKNGGPTGTLRVIRPDGSKRDLTVVPLEGPRFEPRKLDAWDEWSIQEVLRLQAFDPIYYNPTGHTSQFGPCGLGPGFPYTFPFAFDIDCQLVYPITYPITYEQFNFTQIIDNAGTWQDFPIITILGPAYTIRIWNQTTDKTLEILEYNLPIGRTITIDLRAGVKTIELDDGTNLSRYLSLDSDLGEWSLAPGENTVQVTMGSHGGATNVQIAWHDRYIGI